ncbi:MAG TPA: hypothetical protein VM577_12340, partial [Anaerovoracaceae bacterium]|nr:hypothetical protein [Anaerovoracaceae bacterium]
NHLRPCPLLDNPGRSNEMIEKSKAYSTDMQNPEDVTALSRKCEHAAEKWSVVADRLWTARGNSIKNENGPANKGME